MAEKKSFDPFKDDWADTPEVRKGFKTFKFEDKGDVFVGIYQGKQSITTDDGEILDAFVFDNAEGIPVGIWISHDLERKLEEVPEGSPVRIEYRDDIATKRGLNPMKEFKVQFKF